MPELAAVLADVAVRVLTVAVFVAVGVGLADLLVAFGVVERIAGLSRYLTGPANLPDAVGPAIVATTASPTAGYGMLAEFRERGALDDRATLVAVTVNTFFGFAQHVFTFYAPVLIPILGLRVGLLYVGARAAVALGITLTGVVAGAVLLSPGDGDDAEAAAPVVPDGGPDDEEDEPPATMAGRLRAALATGAGKVREILPRLAVIYTAVALLTAYYDLTRVAGAADPLASLVGLPGAAVPVIAVFAIDTTSGAVAIAPLVPGTFTPEQAVATMLVGGIVSFAVTTFKRSIPFQYGIWGAEFGTKVVAVNTALKVVWIAAALVVLLAGV
jgi:hypothetical protein